MEQHPLVGLVEPTIANNGKFAFILYCVGMYAFSK